MSVIWNVGLRRQFFAQRRLAWLVVSCLLLSGCAKIDFSSSKSAYEPTLTSWEPVQLAVVLGSGGVKGLAHVGVLEVLSAAGIEPDMIVGCSAGAIVGAMYAEGQSISAIKRKLGQSRKDDLLAISPATFPVSVYDGKKLSNYLEKMIHSRRFKQLRIPFALVATNLQFGKETIFNSGMLLPAVQASASIPGIYPPVIIGHQPFVDGAVSSPVPVHVAKKLGAQIVIAVDVSNNGPSHFETSPANLVGVMKRSLEISYIHSSKCSSSEADIVIKVPLQINTSFDDSHNEEIYQAGRRAALEALPKVKTVLRKWLLSRMLHNSSP